MYSNYLIGAEITMQLLVKRNPVKY